MKILPKNLSRWIKIYIIFRKMTGQQLASFVELTSSLLAHFLKHE